MLVPDPQEAGKNAQDQVIADITSRGLKYNQPDIRNFNVEK